MSAIRAASAYVEMNLRDSAFARGLKNAEKSLARSAAKMRKVGGAILGAGVAASAPFGLSVKVFADFDDKIRAVRAVTQATESDFQMLTETAKKLGRTTSFTAGEVAGLMTELGRAGFDPSQIDKMTGAVLDLSKATGTEAALSAGIVAATIRQFGLDASDAATVADSLTVAANSSFNSVQSLGDAMTYAGPVAADLGMSMQETLAILGGLGNIGIQGSQAGSALRRLSTLSAAEAKNMQKIFGVAFTDAAGNVRPLTKVLGEVNAATANLSNSERAEKFNKAFGLLGITAASAIGKSVGSIEELQAKIEGSGGAANKAAKQMESGIGGSFRKLLSAVEGIGIEIGSALAGPISAFADVLATVSGYVTEFIKENQQLVLTIAGVIAGVVAVGAAILSAGVAMSVISFAIGTVVSAMSAMSAVIGSAMAVVGSLGAMFASLLTPIGLVVAAVAGAGVYFFGFTDTGKQVIDWFSGNFGKIFTVVSETVGGIIDALRTGDFALAAEIAFTGVKLAIATALKSILGLFGVTVGEMSKSLASLGKQLAQFLSRLDAARQRVTNQIAEGIGGNKILRKIALIGTGIDSDALDEKEFKRQLRSINQQKLQEKQDAVNAADSIDVDALAKQIEGAISVDGLQEKLDELKSRAREQVEISISDLKTDDIGAPKEIELPKTTLLQNKVKEGQQKISSVGSFSGAIAGRQGGGTLMKQLLDVQKAKLKLEREDRKKQKKRDEERDKLLKPFGNTRVREQV